MRIIFDMVEGPKKGQAFVLKSHQVALFGRSLQCGDFCVGDDKLVSKVQFIAEAVPPVCRISDLGSRNHTFVNNERVHSAEVGDGDEVRLGIATIFRVRVDEADYERLIEEPDSFASSEVVAQPMATIGVEEIEDSYGPELNEGPTETESCFRCGEPYKDLDGQIESEIHLCPACIVASIEGKEDLPGYRFLDEIARGGSGVVWLAEHVPSGRRVAIKVISPDVASSTRMVKLFLRECDISLKLRHSNIVEFVSAGQYQGRMFVVMEYVAGNDAERLLQSVGGKMDTEDVVQIGVQILNALEYAHGEGVVHRDVKPRNILVTGERGTYSVKLGDFGLAKSYRSEGLSSITKEGDVRGSLPFMPKEQLKDPATVGPSSDLFGVAATLYHLLTGTYIYDFSQDESPVLTVLHSDPVPIQDRGAPVPPSLARTINAALGIGNVPRPKNAAEMREALTATQDAP